MMPNPLRVTEHRFILADFTYMDRGELRMPLARLPTKLAACKA
jgi:methyl-accepting chemotaxis protein